MENLCHEVNCIGAFSVSDDKQVAFSKGNLQFTQSTNTWSFAEKQWDMIGEDNVGLDGALADKIDLFGWSTSATNFGVSTSESNSDYSGSFVDWGTNKIGNDAPNAWRTLTDDEWEYLLYDRPNADDLCGVAEVNGVNGLILLPDNWTCPAGVTFKSGFYDDFDHQTFSAEQWAKLEAAGAVFLPASGFRYGSSLIRVQDYGYFWSATEFSSNTVHHSYFNSQEASTGSNRRFCGYGVRLVKDL